MDDTTKSLNVLLNWMNTFDTPWRVITTQDLTDGTILLSVLNFLASDYFLNPKLDTDLTTNEKVERFDDIKIGINKFCTHGIPIHLELTAGLESRTFVRGGTEKDWVTLLELVLLTSIKSTRKKLCIQRMMTQLSRSEQEWLMEIISQSLVKFGLDKQPENPPSDSRKRKRSRVNPGEDNSFNISSRSVGSDTSKKTKIDELQKKLDSLKTEMSATESKYHLLERKSSQDKTKIQDLESELSTQKRNYASDISEKDKAFKKLADQKNELEEQLIEKNHAVKTLERKVKFVKEEARDWENRAQSLKKTNEDLVKRQELGAISKLSKMEKNLEVANTYREKLEKQENEFKKELESYQKQVEQLNNYKEMYEKQLTRVAELEQELSDTSSLKQQLECKRNKDRTQDAKLADLEQKLIESEAVKHSLKQKLDEAHTDMQELEDIVKNVQKAEAAMQTMRDTTEVQKHVRKIAALENELARTVPQSQHSKTVFALEAENRRVKELSKKLNDQANLRMERMKDRGRIEELEKKNAQMNQLVASFQRQSQTTKAQLNIKESERVASIKELQHKQRNEISSLKQQLNEEKLMHNREQRLMISAVKSISNGLLGFT